MTNFFVTDNTFCCSECKDSICDDPKMVLGSYVKGPNNKICRVWAERLGLGHRIVVSYGIHSGRTEVNQVFPWTLSIELNILIPLFFFGYHPLFGA